MGRGARAQAFEADALQCDAELALSVVQFDFAVQDVGGGRGSRLGIGGADVGIDDVWHGTKALDAFDGEGNVRMGGHALFEEQGTQSL